MPKKKRNTVEFTEILPEEGKSCDLGHTEIKNGNTSVAFGTMSRMAERDVVPAGLSGIIDVGNPVRTQSGQIMGVAVSRDHSNRTITVATSGRVRMRVGDHSGAVARADGTLAIRAGDVVQSQGVAIGTAISDVIADAVVDVALFSMGDHYNIPSYPASGGPDNVRPPLGDRLGTFSRRENTAEDWFESGDIKSSTATNHNQTGRLQGGIIDEYCHLNSPGQ